MSCARTRSTEHVKFQSLLVRPLKKFITEISHEKLKKIKKIWFRLNKSDFFYFYKKISDFFQPWFQFGSSFNFIWMALITLVLGFLFFFYRDLSEDEAFVDEIRSSLRFVACVLLRRVKKVMKFYHSVIFAIVSSRICEFKTPQLLL